MLVAVVAANLFVFQVATAYRFSSTSYTIDASVANNVGGQNNSTSYQMVTSGGENVIGNGAGGSYKVGMGYIAQLPHSLQLTVQPSGLAAYWSFDEPSGTAAYDATSYGQTLNLTNQTFAAGKLGNSLQLDATTAVATSANSAAINFQASDFTVSLWYKPSSVTGSRDILRKGTLSGDGYEVALVGAAPIMYLTSSSNYRYCAAVTASVWTHITFVKQGTTLDCYENGVVANGTLGGSIPTTLGNATSQLTVGGTGFFNVGPSGQLDELKMYSTALSAAMVKADYDAMNSGVTSGVTLGSITPGTSTTTQADVITQTDASGYSLAINQDHDLTSGSYTIPAISSGTIASPAVWTEGTTKGLGFTLSATNATAIPGSWNSGNSYAALPGTATTFYSRIGQQSAVDYVTLRLRADVTMAQTVTGTPYTNMLTVTGTMTP